nr:MAG TPA: hypothetical protein [Crassvirales sp.]DAJ95140.1 MAG TPA: hypothetical protein [Crassvirales sp.]DAO34856.1 MAG TPA: hypothetical protein [Crassvirales sp.]
MPFLSVMCSDNLPYKVIICVVLGTPLYYL